MRGGGRNGAGRGRWPGGGGGGHAAPHEAGLREDEPGDDGRRRCGSHHGCAVCVCVWLAGGLAPGTSRHWVREIKSGREGQSSLVFPASFRKARLRWQSADQRTLGCGSIGEPGRVSGQCAAAGQRTAGSGQRDGNGSCQSVRGAGLRPASRCGWCSSTMTLVWLVWLVWRVWRPCQVAADCGQNRDFGQDAGQSRICPSRMTNPPLVIGQRRKKSGCAAQRGCGQPWHDACLAKVIAGKSCLQNVPARALPLHGQPTTDP